MHNRDYESKGYAIHNLSAPNQPPNRTSSSKSFIIQIKNNQTTLTFDTQPATDLFDYHYYLTASNKNGIESCYLPKDVGILLINKLLANQGNDVILRLENMGEQGKKTADLISGALTIEERKTLCFYNN